MLTILLLVLALIAPCSARAQSPTGARPLEAGLYTGFYDFDARTRYDDFMVVGARLGVHLSPWLRMEASFDEVYTSRSATDDAARQITFALRARIEPWDRRLAPYALVGGAFVMLDDSDDPDAYGEAFDTGLGARWTFQQHWMLRGEWILRRQDYTLWRAVEQTNGSVALEGEAATLWGRALTVGVSRVF